MTTEQRARLLDDAIRLRGLKTAREIGAMHGVSRCVVIGLWWRAGLHAMPTKTRGMLVARGQRIGGFKPSLPRQRPFRVSSMPSQAKLAATVKPALDWWSRKYLYPNLMVSE